MHQNKMDNAQANGMDPLDLARIIVKAHQKGKEEIVVGGREKLGVYLKRFLPSTFSKVIRKVDVT